MVEGVLSLLILIYLSAHKVAEPLTRVACGIGLCPGLLEVTGADGTGDRVQSLPERGLQGVDTAHGAAGFHDKLLALYSMPACYW